MSQNPKGYALDTPGIGTDSHQFNWVMKSQDGTWKGLGLGMSRAEDQTPGLEAAAEVTRSKSWFIPHLLASDLQPLWKDREGVCEVRSGSPQHAGPGWVGVPSTPAQVGWDTRDLMGKELPGSQTIVTRKGKQK